MLAQSRVRFGARASATAIRQPSSDVSPAEIRRADVPTGLLKALTAVGGDELRVYRFSKLIGWQQALGNEEIIELF